MSFKERAARESFRCTRCTEMHDSTAAMPQMLQSGHRNDPMAHPRPRHSSRMMDALLAGDRAEMLRTLSMFGYGSEILSWLFALPLDLSRPRLDRDPSLGPGASSFSKRDKRPATRSS